MTLLFRINVISTKLSSLCCFHSRTFGKTVVAAPFAYRQRTIFTNSCSIYFSKKKVDEVKTPKCPDFEQYFTKVKKIDGMAKNNDEQRKSVIPPPIFDDKTKVKPPPRPVLEKPPANVNGGKSDKNSQSDNDRVKQPDKPQASSDKKYPAVKPLDEFKQFAMMPRSWDSKSQTAESNPPQQKEIVPPQQSQTVNDGKAKEKLVEASQPSTDGKGKIDNIRYGFWLTAAAAVALGTGLLFFTRKSNPDGQTPSVRIKEDHVEEKIAIRGALPALHIPKKVPYLIIGGGVASWSAFKAIKEHVPNAKVLVISNEHHLPYKRQLLSKDLWFPETNSKNEIEQKIHFENTNFYTDPMQLLNEGNGGISILTNRTAKKLKLLERKVVLTDGTEIEYEECLLAIGSKPRNLLVFQTAPPRVRSKISSLRSLEDFQSAKDILNESESVAVIGGGFLASEIAFALTAYANSKNLNVKIYQIFHENANMNVSLPQCLSDWMTNKLTKDYGLSVIPNTQVDSVHMENSKLKLGLLSGRLLVVDHVFVAIGSQPDFAFIQKSGLKLDSRGGIAVNQRLEALPHLYVAGDAACTLGYLSSETETSYDHAIASGRIAGENMAGHEKSFAHQSMFSSSVAPEMSFQSVGLIDSELATVAMFSWHSGNVNDCAARGVVFYMKNDRVVGILLWNIFNKISEARQVIAEGKTLYDLNEVAKLFKIHETDSSVS